ncbi:S1 family peptidase [Microbacterium aurantiacum]|uniref:S1 family peptidase n=1 Tax=Microbacterium aurantiacum TaxID=162393 RepID=UPI0011AF0F0C|nr:S1 family peptidase [Microbacterium aurantiacum]
MKNSGKKMLRLSAFGAAAALAAGGLFAQSAMGVTTQNAPVEGDGYDSFALGLLQSDDALVSVGQADGQIIVTHDDVISAETQAAIDAYGNVVLEKGDEIIAMDQNQIVGGAGYLNDDASGVCSFGFTAWTNTGSPAILTAGHCGVAGDTVWRTTPADDNAPDKPTTPPGPATPSALDAAPVGTFDFSIYGGPNNDPAATDIAGISVANAALENIPAVTDWTSYASGDLAASSTAVTAVGSPAVGQTISKSGRTTGLTTSTVEEIGVWASVSGQFVYGFLSTGNPGTVFGGDSGGAVFSGNTALGVVSGGNDAGTVLFSTDLVNALQQTPGYTVMLDLAEPVVSAPANGATVAPGAAISGTAQANATLEVVQNGTTVEIAVGGDGRWSYAAPAAEGDYTVALKSVQGFNESETVNHAFTVAIPPIVAPVIGSPANGATATAPVTAITGTGVAGATVTLGGDASGTTTVGTDGNWSITVDLGVGEYTVTAIQSKSGKTSPAASVDFTVAPAAPVISSPVNGTLPVSKAPTAVSGTGIDGAEVTLTVDGVEVGTATVKGGVWTIDLPAALKLGAHKIEAVQVVDGVSSAVTTVDVTILADTVVPTPPPGNGGGNGGGSGDGSGNLPATGMDTGAALTGALLGFGAIAAAGALMIFARMRAKTAAIRSAE